MALRITSEFKSDSGVYWKLEIYDANSGTPSSETWDVGREGFKLKYQTETDNRFTGLIPSEVKFTVFVTNSGEQSLIDSIRTSDEKRFQLKVLRSVDDVAYNLYWCGNILNDVTPTEDEYYPRAATLTAIDGLASLKNIPFNENVAYSKTALYTTLIYFKNALVSDVGTSSFWESADQFMTTLVDWSSSNMPTRAANKDPLQYSAVGAKAFITTKDDGSDEWSTTFHVLDQFCKCWGMRLSLSNGQWRIIQVNTYYEMNSASQFYRVYNKAGTLLLSGTADYTLTEGTTYQRLGDAKIDFLPTLRDATATYDVLKSYDLTSSPVVLWNNYYDGEAGPGGYGIFNTAASPLEINLGTVTSISGSSISVKHKFKDGYVGTSSAWNTLIGQGDYAGVKLYYRLKLVGTSNTYYASLNSNDWSTTDMYEAYEMDYPYSIYGSAGATGFGGGNLPTTLAFETSELPEDGTLYIQAYARVEYDWSTFNNVIIGSGTVLASTEATVAPYIWIFAPPITDETQYVRYLVDGEVTTERVYRTQNKPSGVLVNSSENHNVGTLFIGSGPTPESKGRIRTSNDLVTWSDGTDSDWQSYGTGTQAEITQVLTEEILSGQESGKQIYNGAVKITTNSNMGYRHSIKIDGTLFVPYNVTFTANQDTWRGEWYEIRTDSSNLNSIFEAQPYTPDYDTLLNDYLW